MNTVSNPAPSDKGGEPTERAIPYTLLALGRTAEHIADMATEMAAKYGRAQGVTDPAALHVVRGTFLRSLSAGGRSVSISLEPEQVWALSGCAPQPREIVGAVAGFVQMTEAGAWRFDASVAAFDGGFLRQVAADDGLAYTDMFGAEFASLAALDAVRGRRLPEVQQ